ncbi:MAG: hypothetical protein ABEJ26_09250 [Halosimplex sp.]
MPDDRAGREEQARDRENRQRRREVLEELERSDESEPPVDDAELDALDVELDSVEFPATGLELVEAVGYQEVESAAGTHELAELLPRTDRERYESASAVRVRVRRPRIATAMKRIVEAADEFQSAELGTSQYEAYERTLRALKAIEEDDEDEGIEVLTDWIVEYIREEERTPGSRDVRRRAAEFCRSNGYEVGSDEWLGV